MMRARAVVVAVALVLAPLGARGADLVVWWEKGFNPKEDASVRQIIASNGRSAPRASGFRLMGTVVSAVVFKAGRNIALAKEFVRFLVA